MDKQLDQLHKDAETRARETWTITWISVNDQMPEPGDETYLIQRANGEIGIAEYEIFFDVFPEWTVYQKDNVDYVDIDDKSDNRIVNWAKIPKPRGRQK